MTNEKMKMADKNSADLHPDRYCIGKYECWDVLAELLKNKELNAFQGYLFGCAFKYLWRLGEKDDMKREITKAINYLNKLSESL